MAPKGAILVGYRQITIIWYTVLWYSIRKLSMKTMLLALLVLLLWGLWDYEYTHEKPSPQFRTYEKLFSQKDPLWSKVKLAKGSSNTFGRKGCLIVAMTMIAYDVGHPISPLTFKKKAQSAKLITKEGWTSEYALSEVVSNVKLVGRFTSHTNRNTFGIASQTKHVASVLELVKSSLEGSRYVMAKIDGRPRTHEFSSHWVLLERPEKDDFIIVDPGSGTRTSLRARYGNTKRAQSLNDLIIEAVIYESIPTTPSR